MTNMKVFISHSTEDTDIVKTLSSTLQNFGVVCYVAEMNPLPGVDLSQKVKYAIQSSDCLLAILTEGGSRSPWVNQEIAFASAFNKPIIPLVEKGVKIEGILEGKEFILFDRNNHFDALIKTSSYLSNLKAQKEQRESFNKIVGLAILLWALSSKKD